ncbi:MAG: MOSC domain-containing protein [Nocardioides sp.]|nr:MOSC domain-containing protein [Nocardioides sp.]
MRVESLRRYPVKSCGGEDPDTVLVDARGLAGDRLWAVVDVEGKLASGKDSRRFRRRDPVFDLQARLVGQVPEVRLPQSEWTRVDEPGADAWVSGHFGAPVAFREEGEVSHMDAGRVSIVGSATLAAMREADARRFRANLVVETDTPWIEETWLDADLRIGEVVLRPVQRIQRCRMVDIAQDGVPPRPGLLKSLARERDLHLAVYADVVQPGRLTRGDDAVVI